MEVTLISCISFVITAISGFSEQVLNPVSYVRDLKGKLLSLQEVQWKHKHVSEARFRELKIYMPITNSDSCIRRVQNNTEQDSSTFLWYSHF